MSLYGPKDVFFLVDGFDLLANKLKGATWEDEALQEETTGLGDEWEEHSPVGKRRATLTQVGAFFDDATNAIHDAMKASVPASPNDPVRIISVGVLSDAIGSKCVGFEGAYSRVYKLIAAPQGAELQKADVEYTITGAADAGVVLQPLEQKTADWDTESTPVDLLTGPTSNGLTAYMQVKEVSGFTNFVGTVRDSPDDITYGDLVAFPDNVVAPYGARVTVAGAVERYLAFDGDVTGTGTITTLVHARRNP